MVEKPYYAELVDRNWGFLSPEEQNKIKLTRVFLAGCGLGSNIAVLATRTGFTKFILADGDKVDINNLNRQAFRFNQVGENKAEATAQLIKEINSEAETEMCRWHINEKDAAILVAKADLIVNTVDPEPVIFAINKAACSENKPVFFPLNIGFGGLVFVFSPESATLEEMGGNVAEPTLFLRLMEKAIPYSPHLGTYIEKVAENKNEILQGIRPGPQLGVAAYINASLVVTAMIRKVLGLPLKIAPQPLTLDAWNCSL